MTAEEEQGGEVAVVVAAVEQQREGGEEEEAVVANRADKELASLAGVDGGDSADKERAEIHSEAQVGGWGTLRSEGNGEAAPSSEWGPLPTPSENDGTGVAAGGSAEQAVEDENCLYPQRPGRPDCTFYVHTGMCKFGMGCRWHHPAKIRSRPYEEHPRNVDKAPCESWAREGRCRLGALCKFDHPGVGAKEPDVPSMGMPPPIGLMMAAVPFGTSPYPIRPGEPLCSFFMKNGACKFGSTCKFDHPEDCPAYQMVKQHQHQVVGGAMAGMMNPMVNAGMLMGIMKGSWSDGGGLMLPHHAMQPSDPQGSGAAYPRRPEQQECAYYVRTGMCRYGESCRFDHPPERASAEATLREEEKVDRVPCQHFMRTGGCAYGVTCRFRHSTEQMLPSEHEQQMMMLQQQQQQQNNEMMLEFASLSSHLPQRPGMQACQFYMRTGKCAYGSRCKWDHPKSRAGQPIMMAPMGNQQGIMRGQGVPSAALPSSYMPANFGAINEGRYMSALVNSLAPLGAANGAIPLAPADASALSLEDHAYSEKVGAVGLQGAGWQHYPSSAPPGSVMLPGGQIHAAGMDEQRLRFLGGVSQEQEVRYKQQMDGMPQAEWPNPNPWWGDAQQQRSS
jgi:hypothetical protein